MKHFKFQSKHLLLSSIILVALILLVVGVVLQRTIGKSNPIAQDMNPISLPLAAMQDQQLLARSKRKEDALLDAEGKQHLQDETIQMDKIDKLIPKLPDLPKEPAKPHEVDISYFDDALFIGDSRTVGLYLYSPIGNADYFASVGMSIFGARSSTGADTGFASSTIASVLAAKHYSKIYLMLGINECAYGIDGLRTEYADFITYLRETVPDAKIIIMANLSISKAFSDSSPYVKHSNLMAVNEMLSEFQDGENVFYLDVNPLFTDESGYLLPEYTWDGAHPYANLYQDWSNFIIHNGL